MFRYIRFYLPSIITLTVCIGMLYGSFWLWLPSVLFIALICTFDQIFKRDSSDKPYRYNFLLDLALLTVLPINILFCFSLFWIAGSGTTDALSIGSQLQKITGVDVIANRNSTAWYHYVVMFFTNVVPVSLAGAVGGHELVHRTSHPIQLWVGRICLSLNWGIAFPLEHVYGHHSYVGTAKDPATAARGDSVYQHIPKSMYLTIINAYEIESQRLEKIGSHFLSYKNTLFKMGLFALLTTLFAYYCAGWMGVLFHLSFSLVVKAGLEVLNYVEHYGLIKVSGQPVQPRHSWNCNHTLSSLLTFNLTRHSHHHANAQVHYQDLKPYKEQPEMPGGLISAFFSSLIPSLWRRKIAPKLIEWDLKQAVEDEYELIAQANKDSGWPELLNSPKHCLTVSGVKEVIEIT